MATVQLKYLLLCVCILVTQTRNGVYGQCTTAPINQAVYEGAQNTMMTCNSRSGVRWSITPVDAEQYPSQITTCNNTVYPSFARFYSISQTNLVIKTAQLAANTEPITTTAGTYVARYGPDGNSYTACAKLIIVPQQGPSCTCTAINPKSNNVSCSLQYADSSDSPVNVKMTWTANGKIYKNETLSYPGKTVNGLLTSTSTIAISASDRQTYTCTVAFTEPQDDGFYFLCNLAENAPTFTASCTPKCQFKAKRDTGGYKR